MLRFAINHMAVPGLGYEQVFALAERLGCVGVELRNDLDRRLFDGDEPGAVSKAAASHNQRIVGLSQVYPFNDWSDVVFGKVSVLIAQARACGAETISLIPRNDGQGLGNGERQANLRIALREIKPLLDEADLVALVEPLGFEISSLRSKAETIDVIESLGGADRFKLVHDTFHHYLAGGGPIFAEHTGIVHISGVTDHRIAIPDIRDEHRVLVDENDRLGNIEQIDALLDAGYSGVFSFEPFSPAVHQLADPETPLRQSIDFIRARTRAAAA